MESGRSMTDDFVSVTAEEASCVNMVSNPDELASAGSQLLRQKMDRIASQFSHVCPPLYYRTDVLRLPMDKLEIVMPYSLKDGRSLFLHGDAGSCKTRVMWYKTAMEFARSNGKLKVTYIEADEFAVASSSAFNYSASKELIDRCKSCDLLLFDDVFKFKMNEHSEVLFFGILNSRMENMKATIFTANVEIAELKNMFNYSGHASRAEPIMRRLGETCKFVEFRRK